jgi:hypothetical protein
MKKRKRHSPEQIVKKAKVFRFERRAFNVLDQPRSGQRYAGQPKDEDQRFEGVPFFRATRTLAPLMRRRSDQRQTHVPSVGGWGIESATKTPEIAGDRGQAECLSRCTGWLHS